MPYTLSFYIHCSEHLLSVNYKQCLSYHNLEHLAVLTNSLIDRVQMNQVLLFVCFLSVLAITQSHCSFFFPLAIPHVACRDLSSQPGNEPGAPTVKLMSPNHWSF